MKMTHNRRSALVCWLGLSTLLAGCGAAREGYEEEPTGAATEALHCARPDGFSDDEWSALKQLTPLPEVPIDTTNQYADAVHARKLGQQFFFDAGFSGPLKVASDLGEVGEIGKVACASCHSGPSMDDRRSEPRTVSLGADFHSRNAPGIVNSSFYTWTNWGGRFSAQWELPMPVTESGVIMNGNRLQVAHRIFDVYRRDYERVFGALDPELGTNLERFPPAGKPKASATAADGAWEGMQAADQEIVNWVFVNYAKALGAYFRVLVSKNAPFDKFMAGKHKALSAEAQRGAKLFVGKAHCSGCHSGSQFSDQRFHNLGVPQTGERVPASDDGRFKDVPPLLTSAFNAAGPFSDDPEEGLRRLEGLTNPMPESSKGSFRTAGLRGVAHTAPYMHSGQIGTLEEVVEFYNQGGGTPVTGTKNPRLVPLGLTEDEKADIVAFLYALSGDPVPERYLKH